MKRCVAYCLMFLAMVLLLTGCGDGQETESSGAAQEGWQFTEETPSQSSVQDIEESQTPKTEKTKIIVRGQEFDEPIKECVYLFNEQSEEYVVLLDSMTGDVHYFLEKTYDDLTGGLGADIFTVDSLYDAYSLVDTGIVADLKPYLEASGIREDDYFPFAFDGFREGDKLYGLNVYVQPEGCWVNTAVLGEEPYKLETVLTNLQHTSAKTTFRSYSTWEDDLAYFLSGSDNLWGMVDEENGTCNFEGGLFQQLIETTYAHSLGHGTQPTVAGSLMDTYWYKFLSEEELTKEEKVRIGYFSENGHHTLSSLDNMFLINADSPNAEGAWKFLKFMLGEQAQSLMKYDRYPVSRAVFEKLMAQEMEEGAVLAGEEVVLKAGNQRYYEENGAEAYRARFDLTEEKVAEIRGIVENTKATPLKMTSIIKIIAEDYKHYQWGDTTVEEFAAQVEAKVKRYLDMYE